MIKSKFVLWLLFISLYLLPTLNACKSRLNPVALQDDQTNGGASSSSENNFYQPNNQRIAQVIGLALVEYLRTGETPSTQNFIEARLKVLGVSAEEFHNFENLILTYYEVSNPNTLDNETLRALLRLSPEEAGWIRTYYNFENISLMQGEGLTHTQSAIAFEKYETNREEIDWLRSGIMRASIQTLAEEKGVAVSDIRNLLWKYNLSIVSMWQNVLEPGQDSSRSLYEAAVEMHRERISKEEIATKRGLSIKKEIATTLGVSLSALENLFHYIGIENNGVAWSDSEETRLENLWGQIDIRDIAIILSRTEESVRAKAKALNLTDPKKSPRRLLLPGMDLNDRTDIDTNHEILRRFLSSTLDVEESALAAAVNVAPSTIRSWRQRFDLVVNGATSIDELERRRLIRRQDAASKALKNDPDRLTRFKRQDAMIEKEVEIWKKWKKSVTQENCKELLGILWNTYVYGNNYFVDNLARLVALSNYITKNPEYWQLLWSTQIKRPREYNDPQYQLRIHILKDNVNQIRPTVQVYYLGLMVEEIASKGELVGGFQEFAKRNSVNIGSLVGTGVYKTGGPTELKGIFNGGTSVVLNRLKDAIEASIETEADPERQERLTKFSFKSMEDKLDHNDPAKIAVVQNEKESMLLWGEEETIMTALVPDIAAIKKKYGGNWRIKKDSPYWPSISTFQIELMQHMISKGYTFKKRGQRYHVTQYPEGTAVPLPCAQVQSVVESESLGKETN